MTLLDLFNMRMNVVLIGYLCAVIGQDINDLSSCLNGTTNLLNADTPLKMSGSRNLEAAMKMVGPEDDACLRKLATMIKETTGFNLTSSDFVPFADVSHGTINMTVNITVPRSDDAMENSIENSFNDGSGDNSNNNTESSNYDDEETPGSESENASNPKERQLKNHHSEKEDVSRLQEKVKKLEEITSAQQESMDNLWKANILLGKRMEEEAEEIGYLERRAENGGHVIVNGSFLKMMGKKDMKKLFKDGRIRYVKCEPKENAGNTKDSDDKEDADDKEHSKKRPFIVRLTTVSNIKVKFKTGADPKLLENKVRRKLKTFLRDDDEEKCIDIGDIKRARRKETKLDLDTRKKLYDSKMHNSTHLLDTEVGSKKRPKAEAVRHVVRRPSLLSSVTKLHSSKSKVTSTVTSTQVTKGTIL